MRVRISYGVELEHNTDLLSMAGGSPPTIAGHISAEIVKDISELRAALSTTDQTLADFVAILDGYAKVASSGVEFVDDTTEPLSSEGDDD